MKIRGKNISSWLDYILISLYTSSIHFLQESTLCHRPIYCCPFHQHSEPFLRLPLPTLDEPHFLAQALQSSRKRRFLRDLQRAERVQLDALLLQRLGRLPDFLPQRLGALLIATVMEGEFLFEAIARLRVFKDGGLERL